MRLRRRAVPAGLALCAVFIAPSVPAHARTPDVFRACVAEQRFGPPCVRYTAGPWGEPIYLRTHIRHPRMPEIRRMCG
jgi:hypothetical protein